MADSFKNNIQIGIKIDPQNQAQTNLNTIIKKLNENKINLDLTIKGDASKQLENLSLLIDTLKSKMGGKISLGDLDKVINNSVSGLTKLNGELQKENELNTKLNNNEYISNQTNAYKQLTSLQNEEYSIKEKLITAEGQYRQQLEARLVEINLLKNAQQQNIQDNNLTNQQKELELTNQRTRAQEQLNQSKAKNNDSNANAILKESQAYQEEQKQVQTLIQNKIKLLEIEKQSLTRQYGTNIDTTVIDQAITKLKSLDTISLKDLQNEFRNINTQIKSTEEVAKSGQSTFEKFKTTLSNFGIYISGALVFGKMTQELQQGVEWIKYLDESFTDMAITMDITREQFDKMSVSIDDMSKQLGVNAKDVHDIAKLIGELI